MKNSIFYKLALQAGGSHYPTVGGVLLDKFGDLVIQECIDIIANAVEHREPASVYTDKIKEHFGVEESKQEKFSQAVKTAFEGGIDLSGQDTP
jgi:hypothetical protein